ncbi:MAG: hypothetical protein VCC01_05910 [Candidatus Hydrogenedentota bacterium]
MPRHPHIVPAIAFVLAVTLALPVPAQLLQYKPGREYRSLNTGTYEITIQKNGRVDVALTSGEPVYLNAFPMVWFANKKAPRAIRLDGRYSQRFEVNDALGRGQGMRIRYNDVQWTLRAYPTKPYLAVQLAYINSSKKPVTIKQLTPWAIGDPKNGSVILGPGTLDSIMLLDGMDKESRSLSFKNGEAPNMISLLNPETGRSLIAGFTTQVRAINTLHIQALNQNEDDTDQLNYMRAANTYDPPVTVQPGEVLESETLYLAITETDPLLALERYAKAVAVTNEIPVYSKSPPRNILFKNTYENDKDYLAALEEAAKHIKSIANNDVPIRFILQYVHSNLDLPSDKPIAKIADNLRSHGFLVGLLDDPFTFHFDSDAVKAHPDWFLTVQSKADSSDTRPLQLLDITVPAAREWFAARLRTSRQNIGFDSVWGINLGLFEEATDFHSGDSLTKIEVIRLAMNTLRTALGNRAPIILAPSELLPAFLNTHRLINPDHPSMALQTPHLGHQYTLNTTSNYPQAALQGINLIEAQDTLDSTPAWGQDTLNAPFIPPLIRPAKPQDLFFNNAPNIWLKRGNDRNGRWILAGINNDTDSHKTITLQINNPRLGLQPQFTLFDPQQKHYYGQIQTPVNISVAPNKMRILLLRQYKNVPLLLGTTFPISQTLPSKMNESWNPGTLTLTGTLTTTQPQGTLYFLHPPGYKIESARINDTPIQWSGKDNTLTLEVQSAPNTPTTYTLTFTKN